MSDNKKKMSCEVVQDLLPLYQDGACSEDSKVMIEEHLRECQACQSVADCLKNTKVDDQLTNEKNDVLQNHANKERRRSYTVGVVTAAVLMIPVIVCLICNLAVGKGLDWFFIVLASLAVFASVTVVPLITEKNRGLWTLGCFTGALLMLLLVINIYTGGRWFLLAAVPTIFGISVFLAPYVIKRIKLPKALANQKGLIVMIWDTLWLFAIITVVGLATRTGGMGYWRNAIPITAYCVLLPWVVFLIIRYSKMPGKAKEGKLHGLIKGGICVIVIGAYLTITNNVINSIIGGGTTWHFADANFADWTSIAALNANIWIISLVSTTAIGIILIIAGIIVQNNKKIEGK